MEKLYKLLLRVAFVFCCLFSVSALAQGTAGQVREGLKISSKLMGKDVKYAVYLPPGYETGSRYYPVVYLLHGYSDDESGWVQFGEVQQIADRAIADGEIPPMVIVMPDGGVTFYMNDYAGKEKWGDMFVQEFIPQVEKQYRIRQKREFRGISGLSMGGFGATVTAMRNPGLFVAFAAFSSAYFTDAEIVNMPEDQYKGRFALLFGEGLAPEARTTEHFKAHSPFHIAKEKTEEVKKLRMYIDCGDDDFLYKGNASLHIHLRELGIPHEYRVRDGGHTWHYWRTGLAPGLKFIGQSFHR